MKQEHRRTIYMMIITTKQLISTTEQNSIPQFELIDVFTGSGSSDRAGRCLLDPGRLTADLMALLNKPPGFSLRAAVSTNNNNCSNMNDDH